MTARVALLAVWASHALLSPLAIVLLFEVFKKHFYAEATPGSRCDPYLGLDACRLSQFQKAADLQREEKGEKKQGGQNQQGFEQVGKKSPPDLASL